MSDIDIQCEQIAGGLRRLEEIVLQPFASKALDLPDNAITARHQDQLARLRRSLEQYVKREGNLTYIGLIGHFSAGKSSLINSLLDLSSSPHARKTGLHPTDDVITLLTHDENAQALLGVSGGGSVPIRIQTMENDFLRHVVLADSPGTGDPHLIEEMARDFLPICDLILFVFSAASPIDETDLPTLRELHKRLPFIPLLFVVTRADELRRDRQVPLTDSNFNEAKAAEFLAETLSRVSRLLESSQYNKSNFAFIDNMTQFRIVALRDELLRRSDPLSPSSRVTVHSHKVHYYLSASKDLKAFFADFLDAKLSDLHKIVSTSDKNIQKYNESVDISNSNLTKSWYERYSALQRIGQNARDAPANLSELKPSPDEMDLVAAAETELQEAFKRNANTIVERIADHVRVDGFLEVKDKLHRVTRMLQKRTTLDDLTVHGHGLAQLDVSWSLDRLDLISTHMLASRLGEVRDASRSMIEGCIGSARHFVQQFSAVLNQHMLIDECESIVTAAQNSLSSDLDKYFASVQVYRAGVFSMGTKGSIARLGIGEEMARLETEFTEEDKDSLVLKARNALFPQMAETLASITKRLRELADKLRPLETELRSMATTAPDRLTDVVGRLAKDAEVNLRTELTEQLGRETTKLVEDGQSRLGFVIGTTIQAYEKARGEAAKRRLITYGIIAVVCIAIGFGSILAYTAFKRPVGQSLGEVLLWGTVASLVANAIGFGLALVKNNYPEAQRQMTEQYLVQLRNQADTAITNLTTNHHFTCLDAAGLGARVKKIYSVIGDSVTDDGWQHEANELFARLRTMFHDLIILRTRYLEIVDELVEAFGSFFRDPERNLAILKAISEEVKDRAIQPSFKLLAGTKIELQEVKKAIEQIEFA